MSDDTQLIDEALAGRSASFGQLVLKYQDRLFNSMAQLLGSADDARDVTQDAFVQAFVKLDSFTRQAAFYTWLYRIAFNLAITLRRRQRRTLSLDASKDATGEEPSSPVESPDAALARDERGAQVRAALAMLSDEHRAILVLRELDDCCYETIAAMLELPVGTVRSWLFRARAELRTHLKAMLQEDAH